MRSGEVPAGDGRWVDDLGLAAALADALVVLAPGGAISWVNDAFCRLVGEERDVLLGADGLGLVHPDELARAIDGIDFATRFPGLASVAPYRIRTGDGRWLPIELKSGAFERPDGTHLVLLVRDGTARSDLNRALQAVAGGEPLATTVDLVGRAVRSRWADTAMVVSVGVRGGSREVLGGPLPDLLAEHAHGALGHLGVAAPWELVAGDDVAIVDRSELSGPLLAAADDAGFEGFAVARLPDPTGQPACMIVWFVHTAIGQLEFRHAAAELTELLGLALERRHHHWELWHVASHDSLTGLLNRAGFFDRFVPEVEATRRSGAATTAVLFVDLDGLKGVNDRGGHAAGDRLLVDVAGRLRSVVEPSSVVARLGGDEFVVAVALDGPAVVERAEGLAQAVVDVLAEPGPGPRLASDRGDLPVAASVGIALDDGEVAPVRILELADAAMYRAKSAGRARWAW